MNPAGIDVQIRRRTTAWEAFQKNFPTMSGSCYMRHIDNGNSLNPISVRQSLPHRSRTDAFDSRSATMAFWCLPRLVIFGWLLVAVVTSAIPASAALIYQNNFDAAAQLGSGISASMSGPNTFRAATGGSWNAAGWSGNAYVNSTAGVPATLTEFSFSGLASHTAVSLAGVLGFLDSWDSTNGTPAPDFLNVYIDHALVASLTSDNASGNVTIFAGANVIAYKQQVDSNFFFSDTLIDLATASFANFAHTGSSLTIGFQAGGGGWQGNTDESWGLDSFAVTYNADVVAVPEPASMVIWALGALGCVFAGHRRRKSA